MACVELPKDATGRQIPLDIKVLYNDRGIEYVSDYAELEKRAEAHGLGDDPSLAQLLHIIQFKEAVVNGHKRTMRELAVWERNIAETVEQRIKETEAADGQ